MFFPCMVYTFSEHGHTIEITSPVVKVNKKISPSPAGRENHLIPARGIIGEYF